MNSRTQSSKIAVAVSGGADSLYSLVRLKEEGCDIIALHGIFLRSQHPAAEAQAAAMRERLAATCASLDIPLFVEDLSDAFSRLVIRPFIEAYAQGRTPNPCVLCNAEIKFGLLRKAAQKHGAERIATGHYAKLLTTPFAGRGENVTAQQERTATQNPAITPELAATPDSVTMPDSMTVSDSAAASDLATAPKSVATPDFATASDLAITAQDNHSSTAPRTEWQDDCGPILLQGADTGKDQSYFLALVPGEALAQAVFPLEEAHKKDVLAVLAQRGIAVPQPGESQEVCFVPDDEYRAFVPQMAKDFGISLSGPGPMLLEDGKQVGVHKGLWQYTEGQRKGLGVGWKEPLHVLAKEVESNILRLGPKASMKVGGCLCREANILFSPRHWPETLFVKTRYREKPKRAKVLVLDEGSAETAVMRPALHIYFEEPDTAVAPGQIAAVYVPWEEGRLRLVAGAVIDGIM